MANWDTMIAVAIMVALGLGFWAKISKQTIPELIGNIVDRIRGTSEDVVDYGTEVVSYE